MAKLVGQLPEQLMRLIELSDIGKHDVTTNRNNNDKNGACLDQGRLSFTLVLYRLVSSVFSHFSPRDWWACS